jgi:hypothetical protein
MRQAVILAPIAMLVVGASVALAATGHAPKPRASSLAAAAARTARVSTQRYAVDLRIMKDSVPHVLRARSAVAPGTISVWLELAPVRLPNGTFIPGSDTEGLIDGPFLYERMPDGLAAQGSVDWLRVSIASLSPSHPALSGMHGMTAMPLLHVLGEARAHAVTRDASLFRGTVAYDDPIVVTGLRMFTAGLQFRDLRVTAWIDPHGLVRRVRLTGHTADRKTTLLVNARLYAFGRPVRVTPPAEGTFMDDQLLQLSD